MEFLVNGCRGRASTWKATRINSLHRNFWDTVIILEEGNLPHPRCPRCDMLVSCKSLNGRHVTTAQCTKGVERKRRRLVEEEMRESVERDFKTYGRPLVAVTYFKYLGWILVASDDYWSEVVGNLKKEWKSWAWMTRILGREVAIPRVSGMFFKAVVKAVVQAVLLFGSDTWVMIPHMVQALRGFQRRADRRMDHW